MQSARPAAAPSTAPRLFMPEEVAEVLAHYELGTVTGVRELIGGGAGSPKALVECARGRFVLKRRAPGRDNPFRVAFCHEVILHLRAHGYPAPELVGTRAENNSLVQLDGRVYELFVFVDARPFARHPAQARSAGHRLSELHARLAGFTPRHPEPPARPDPLATIRRAVDALGTPYGGVALASVFTRASDALRAPGDPPGPAGLVHGDWHPGNLLFAGDDVHTVFDFDGVHRAPLADDLAQGLVQFSIVRSGDGPEDWPAEPDAELARALWDGYAAGPSAPRISPESAPFRMARSLAAEWGEGVVGGVLGGPETATRILGAAQRKAAWLVEHADTFAAALRG
ncbi:MAG: hypothetical protein DHS20C14_12300 [Phycisphaeraceae bacterium]|nr:MAG: hypothetical protein DHS20C14_12300 [Phycisphaeraceae bacterium]